MSEERVPYGVDPNAPAEERIIITRMYEEKPIRAVNLSLSDAIEIVAKADWQATVCAKNGHSVNEIPQDKWNEEWKKLRADYKKIYRAGAENALKALLEHK